MIDLFCIFTTGGLILWYKTFFESKFDLLLNNLIKNILLDEKKTKEFYVVNGTVLRWRILNEAGLIFVVAYQEVYNVLYVDKLIDYVVLDFVENQLKGLKKESKIYIETPTYTDVFMRLLRKWEKYCQDELENKRSLSNVEYKKKISALDTEQVQDYDKDKMNEDKVDPVSNFNPNPNNYKAKRSQIASAPTSKKGKKQPEKKTARVWDDANVKITKETMNKFDHSDKTHDDDELEKIKEQFLNGPPDPDNLNDRSIDEILSEEETDKPTDKKGGIFSKLTSTLKNYIGNKVLTEQDLRPVMEKLITLLMEKNVAKEIAESLCASVSKSLLNTKTESFTTIAQTVKNALKETVSKILTPKTDIDLVRLALASKKRGEPYKILFIGVNGVGKSTNLAKVAYMLMNNGLKLLIAACDNFRSGAVEQLKVHGRALGVEVYDKGYKDDPAYICKEAIDDARKRGFDCVLIDTAGRMQDNEPLMKSLAKLVEINQPDSILFVGEALTGNSSVDQLKKFNQALIDFSKKENPRIIDGIVLTKFDTVDDKVGAALTMVYTTGKPIVYVGTGQKYTNLKKLNVNHVLNALFA